MNQYGNYLIPANSKKSMLILGFFTGLDLIIFSTGVILTLLMLMMASGNNSLTLTLIILAPALIATFLVLPVPYYHNVLQLIINIVKFFTERKRFYWKGWNIHGEE